MNVTPRRICTLSHEARFVASAPDRARIVAAAKDGCFTILDGELRTLGTGKLPVASGSLAVHPVADVLAVSSASEVAIADFSGRILHRLAHDTWADFQGGDVAFLRGGHLLALVPADEGARAIVLDPDHDVIVCEQIIEVPELAGFSLVPTPTEDGWAVWAGAGQDGQWTFWLRLEEGNLSVEEVEDLDLHHGPPAFHPAGTEMIVVTENGLERRAVPGFRILGSVVSTEDRDFGYSAFYLGSHRALVTDDNSSRLYLVDLKAMTLGEEIVIAGHPPTPASDLYGLKGDDELCTDLWYFERLPRDAVLTIHGRANQPQTLMLLEGPPMFPDAR